MENSNYISVRVAGKTHARITTTDQNWPLSNPVFAINWFDTKSLILYNIYNFLAQRSVHKVEGRAHFKGKITKTLYGEKADRRDVLLIVNYPATQNFLIMLQSGYFKLVSILRMAAVKRFTFGFTRRRDKGNAPADHNFQHAYAVHHYHGVDISEQAIRLAQQAGVQVYYAGWISSRVSVGPQDDDKAIPCLMDGIIVFQGTTEQVISDMVASPSYCNLLAVTKSSFVAQLSRLL